MSSLVTYARAALPLVPGASRLPWVAGGGGDVPVLELTRDGVRVDPGPLARYREVCGFAPGDRVPATFPHVLAFDLHMQLMTDGRFPFPAVGLVHIANAITVHEPISAGDVLSLRVRAAGTEPHPKGTAFSIESEALLDGRVVWEDRSTMLRRGSGSPGGPRDGERGPVPDGTDEWSLPEGLGRNYAGVSGDRNPIHLHAVPAKLLGFPRAIAHGMWTKARCLAALEPELPDRHGVDVRFGRPILLPGRVRFGADGDRFAVRSADGGQVHLEGSVTR